MKKINYSPKRFFLGIILVAVVSLVNAQTHRHEHKDHHPKLTEYLKTIPLDDDSLKGFDIKYVMELAAKHGVSKDELSRYIAIKKRVYIIAKYHLDEENSFGNQKTQPPVINAPCTNMGFESGNINGWTLTSGTTTNSLTMAGCCPTAGGQFSMMSGAGTDACGGFPVVAPGGGSTSLMLGDGQGVGAWVDRISQTFQTTSNNQILTVQFAPVLQDGGHASTDQPYFNMKVMDGSGNVLPCGEVNVVAGSGGTAGWLSSGACSTTSYLPWQSVSFDLSSIPVGGNITVQFTAADCIQGGHFGYAYIDAYCGTTSIQSSNPCGGGPQNLCAPAGMQSYVWNGPAGSGVTNASTQCVTASMVGTYSCTTTQLGGCPLPVMQYVLGNTPGAIAAFTSNPVPCSMTMSFTDNTNVNGATITGYHWDFGDGAITTDTSNAQSPSYLYTTAGSYTVTQSVTSAGGCVSTATVAINVAAAPSALFTTPADICNGTVSNFTDNSTTPAATTITSWAWDFTTNGSTDATTQNATFTFPAPGTYTTTLTITNSGGCTNSITHTVVVHAIPVPNFTAPVVCQGTATAFANNTTIAAPSTIATWGWDFTTDGISDNATQSPTFTFPTAGTFTTTLTATGEAPSNCVATYSLAITVNAVPVAAFTTADVCNTIAANFNNTSTSVAGAIMNWDFTNNGSVDANTTSPTFTYPAPGNYTIELEVTNPGGCKDSITHPIVVHDNPIPSFTATHVCQGIATTYTNNSTINAPSVATWSWDYTTDGTSDNTTQNPTFVFPTAGTFTTTLTATGEAPTNCAATFSVAVIVSPVPVSLFTANTVCIGNSTTFTDLSTVAAPDNISSTTWNFGDASASVVFSPSHPYAACGNFNASLTVITNNGCNATFNTNVTVNCGPVAAFTSANICLTTPMLFTDASTVTGSAITGWAWDFTHNGTTDNTTQNPTNTYPSAGTFNVQLIVTGANGCIDTTIQPVTVYPNPQVAFITVNACDQTATSFNNLSIINAPDNIATWGWDFDGNATIDAVVMNPTYIYPGGPNTYNVTLTATSNHACVSSATIPVTVYPNPNAAFTSTTVCKGTASTLNDASTVAGAGNNVAQWHWDYDNNGTTDNVSQNANYIFPNFGAQTVELLVITNNGCKDSLTQTVNVNPNPVPSFSVTSVCFGLANNFTDLSTVNGFNGSTINTWAWDFDGNATVDNMTQNPTNVFPSAGTFNSTLAVATNNGCLGTVTLPVTVYPIPVASFGSDPSCVNAPIQFTDMSTVAVPDNINAWSWDLTGDLIADANTQNPSHTYATAGPVNIILIVTSNNGCKDTIIGTTVVNPNPVAQFAGDVLSGCPIHCVNFTDGSTITTGNIVQWNWNLGNGTPTSATTQNTSSCYTNTDPLNPATFDVTLSIVSDSGCTATITKTNYITVFPKPIAAFTFGPVAPAPDVTNPLINFTDQSTGPSTWAWNFGDFYTTGGGTSTLQNPTYNYNNPDPATYTVWLNIANIYGCVDSTSLPVPIAPEFTFYCPNAVSPNGDLTNDGFRGYGIGIATYNMWIYDRWGNMIFNTTDITNEWDAKVQGRSDNIVQEDVYVWKVKLTDVFGKTHSYIGHVTVVR